MRVFLILAPLILLCAAAPAQQPTRSDSLGLPGDNLNLYAVLRIFQESATLEEFEKKLNSEDARINNLDLNGDDKIDFIRVIDNVVDGNHDIVLQVPVSETEAQDVAVIRVERDAQNRVTIQIIGDEELYGKNYIVEPRYEPAGESAAGATPNPGYTGAEKETVLSPDGETVAIERTTPAAVAGWPVVQCIYMPAYEPWPSPWYYGYYPPWWRPWRPFFWHYYWGFHLHQYGYYFGHYRRWNVYRNERARVMYTGSLRRTSVIFVDRNRSGAFRATYARPELRRVGVRQSNVLRGRDLNPRAPRISTTPRERQKPRIEAAPRGRQQDPGNTRPPVVNPGRRTAPGEGAARGRREPQEGKARARGERPGK
jgi:hypothetical protein